MNRTLLLSKLAAVRGTRRGGCLLARPLSSLATVHPHGAWKNSSPRTIPLESSQRQLLSSRHSKTVVPGWSQVVRSLSSTKNTNKIPFLLADIGEGIAEVELLQWFVQEGDTVHQFDRIAEVQSDKATVEITSRYDGVIASLEGTVGSMLKVGQPLVYLYTEQQLQDTNQVSSSSSSLEEPKEETLVVMPTTKHRYSLDSDEDTTDKNPKVLCTPAVRKLGMDYNIDLSTLVGTGPKGRLLKSDVLQYLKETGRFKSTESEQKSAAAESTTESTAPSTASTTPSTVSGMPQEDEIIDLRGYSRLMAKTMTESLQIPHFCFGDQVDLTNWMTYKEPSLLVHCIKATSLALAEFPILNARYLADAQQIQLLARHHIGIAMDTPRGLVVPVIHDCQAKSMTEIAHELDRLKELAKSNQLTQLDLSEATFTLSNVGALGAGGTHFSPRITVPQVAIGALGTIQRLPRFVGNEVKEAHIMNVTWAGDHRILDGATLARFHRQWKTYLESPMTMLGVLR